MPASTLPTGVQFERFTLDAPAQPLGAGPAGPLASLMRDPAADGPAGLPDFGRIGDSFEMIGARVDAPVRTDNID